MSAPRDDLIRGLAPIRAKDGGRLMVGYPVVFDTWTEINSWEGNFLERVRPNALTQTLKQRGNSVKVQYNHGMHPVVGTSGLGRPTVMRVEDQGLYTETPLSDTSYNRDIIIPQLRDGTLDGMSFRFSVVKETWNEQPKRSAYNPDGLPERSIEELKLYEFGPVDWPAYQATQVGIRHAAALTAWLGTPDDARSEIMSRHGIHPGRLIIQGFDAGRSADASVGNTKAADGTFHGQGAAESSTPEMSKRRMREAKYAARIGKLHELTGGH